LFNTGFSNMNKIAGNIFGLLVIAGIVIYFVSEVKKPVKKPQVVA